VTFHDCTRVELMLGSMVTNCEYGKNLASATGGCGIGCSCPPGYPRYGSSNGTPSMLMRLLKGAPVASRYMNCPVGRS
jgi:hypothetical protein